ncbi:hypothetical protein LQ327_31530 [Actinomycetospora endophytica]|uniref:Excreted virulence factor EspC (Type VII ESX diderm) n=1 Tax=Actinomycetospora endophytica TaxID=2291215 RepID=A0ABS8PI14_9PSEU|nr:hypothetical protein [Actinomycetospora endophytica]MCD2197911.1 hypothetical protein [Actinomycetospora endophytica]
MTADDGFATQPGELTAAAGRFDEAAGIVADALTALRSTLDGLGNYLGTDDQARTFATQYEPKAAEGLAAIDHEVGSARSVGDALRATALDYQRHDNGVADHLQPPR